MKMTAWGREINGEYYRYYGYYAVFVEEVPGFFEIALTFEGTGKVEKRLDSSRYGLPAAKGIATKMLKNRAERGRDVPSQSQPSDTLKNKKRGRSAGNASDESV